MVCLHLHNTQAYRRLVLVIHPDKAKGDKAEAGASFVRQEQQTDGSSTHTIFLPPGAGLQRTRLRDCFVAAAAAAADNPTCSSEVR